MAKNNPQNKQNNYYNSTKEFLKKINPYATIFLTVLIVRFMCVQNNISKDTARRQLRAYLVPTNPTLKVTPDSFAYYIGNRIEMSFDIINNGQTPAYDVRDSVHIKVLPRTEKPKTAPGSTRTFYYPIYGAGTSHTREIHSGKHNVLCVKHFIKTDSSLVFNTVEYGIYFWGKIEYTDIFQEYHFTDFCYSFVFDKPIWEFRTYGKCNQADRKKPYELLGGLL